VTYPTLERYLAALPNGLASYPDVVAKAAVLRDTLSEGTPPELPPELERWRVDPPGVSAWIPEVHFNALMTAIWDHRFAPDRARYDRWVHDRNLRLLGTPLYRVLFMVVSPERLLIGAEKRWSAFRRGSSLRVLERDRHSAAIALSYPPHLQTELSVGGLGSALRAALELAGAKKVVVESGPLGETETRYQARWA